MRELGGGEKLEVIFLHPNFAWLRRFAVLRRAALTVNTVNTVNTVFYLGRRMHCLTLR